MKNPAKAKQLAFWNSPPRSHGGSAARGRRKTARPIDTRSPMHIVLRSSQARGAWSLHRHSAAVEEKAYTLARRYRVRLYRYQNVGNHLHLVAKPGTRREFQAFLRVLPQAIAFLVTGTRKGRPLERRFWDALVFTRVASWGKEWRGLKRYVEKNRIEAAGVPRELVERWFAEVREAWG